ncbi:sulfatase-like hydrolase/transferase [Halalkalicoccus subterraneus]|uniref:sulfatase-like hydrolase/transferase n=1 Tax=Halalkalicoccus subterraneus TaxID=2675002 RepID=UPI000EFC8DF0|nr:sulfatase-like hydrolase/transferase [Halalkalicoccus subterraneus]
MTRNVVLICLDTVRKDYFDEYAPRLQELASVSFEQCRAASAWSTPSHASMLTGRLPHQHGIHTHNRDFSGLARSETFLGDMPDHVALGASANVYASSTFGFDTVFDRYSDVAPHRRFPEGMDMEKFIQDREGDGIGRFVEFGRAALGHDHPLESLANGALFKANDLFRRAPLPKLLDDGASIVAREGVSMVQDADEPFFLFTNFMDAHGPVHHVLGYDRDLHSAPNTWTSFEFDDWDINTGGVQDHHEQDLQYHRELYGAAIDYLDRKVASFVERLQEETDRETTVVITADHGENLAFPADEEIFGHTSSLTEGLLHVPCYLINPPAGYESVEREYVSHLELGTLIAGLAAEETPDVFAERIPAELVGIGVGGAPNDPEEHRYWDRMLRCVYDGETKYVWDSLGGSTEYALDPERPCWQETAAEDVEIPSWAGEFFDVEISEYKERARESESHREVDPDVERRLEELGYR